ncbi:MAG: hypothetical protein LBF22_02165, partial [Deltaproteobacteria bacterium]|nr:hypothetical protein [Deltaproteobacteria bacterium]
ALISLKAFPAVKLEDQKKPAISSKNNRNTLSLIREGKSLQLDRNYSNFIFVDEDRPENIQKELLMLFLEKFPKKFKLPPELSSLGVTFGQKSLGNLALNRLITSKYLEVYGEDQLHRFQYPKIRISANKPSDYWDPRPWNFSQGTRMTMSHFFSDFEFHEGQRISLREDIPKLDLKGSESGLITRVDAKNLRIEIRKSITNHIIRKQDLLKIFPSWVINIQDAKYCRFPSVIVILDPDSDTPIDRRDLYLAMSLGSKMAAIIGPKSLYARALSEFEPSKDSKLKLEKFI